MQVGSPAPPDSLTSPTTLAGTQRPALRGWGLLRLGLSLGLLAWLGHKIDFAEISSTFSTTSVRLLAAALCMHGLGLVICGIRWRILLGIQGILVGFSKVLYLYWIGCFFSTFLPTSIGGDVLKAHAVGQWSGRHLNAFSSVLAERVLGVLALGAIGGLAAFRIVESHWSWDWVYIMAPAILLGLGTLSFLWMAAKRNWFWMRLRSPFPPILNRLLASASSSVGLYVRDRSGLAKAVFLSLLLQAVVVIEYFVVAQAVGLQIPLIYFFALVPAVVLATMLPVSIGGLGVREGVLVSTLVPLGAAPAGALAVGVWIYLLAVLASLGGGVVYWWRGLSLLSAGKASTLRG